MRGTPKEVCLRWIQEQPIRFRFSIPSMHPFDSIHACMHPSIHLPIQPTNSKTIGKQNYRHTYTTPEDHTSSQLMRPSIHPSNQLTNTFIHPSNHLCIDPAFIHCFIYASIHPFIPSFIYSSVHSSIQPFFCRGSFFPSNKRN